MLAKYVPNFSLVKSCIKPNIVSWNELHGQQKIIVCFITHRSFFRSIVKSIHIFSICSAKLSTLYLLRKPRKAAVKFDCTPTYMIFHCCLPSRKSKDLFVRTWSAITTKPQLYPSMLMFFLRAFHTSSRLYVSSLYES